MPCSARASSLVILFISQLNNSACFFAFWRRLNNVLISFILEEINLVDRDRVNLKNLRARFHRIYTEYWKVLLY
jgi:hypothetical protein